MVPAGHTLPEGHMVPAGHTLPEGQPVPGVPPARLPSDRAGSGPLVRR
jgi:hypothetical protein